MPRQLITGWCDWAGGPIPVLAGLSNLKYFWVYDNQLTGSIPALTGLTKQERILVRENQLTGNAPAVPSPSALVAGGSQLCPNLLNPTPFPEWDTATGNTPWFKFCVLPPALVGAASRKAHGGAGTFDLPLAP
jgi:hypothetical protein